MPLLRPSGHSLVECFGSRGNADDLKPEHRNHPQRGGPGRGLGTGQSDAEAPRYPPVPSKPANGQFPVVQVRKQCQPVWTRTPGWLTGRTFDLAATTSRTGVMGAVNINYL